MTTAAPLFLVLALLAALAAYAVLAQSTGEDCRGEYGDGTTVYDLTPLAALLGSQEVITTDPDGQVYYYKVCGSVRNTFCQNEDNTTPAVCQKDSRVPPQYHDRGSQAQANPSMLPGPPYQPASAGFSLYFQGGEEGSYSQISFLCNKSADGTGQFSWVGKDTEYNQYNFQYVTKYACQPTPTPSPTPSPMPGKDNVCCLYYYAKDPSMTKTLCSCADKTCSSFTGCTTFTQDEGTCGALNHMCDCANMRILAYANTGCTGSPTNVYTSGSCYNKTFCYYVDSCTA